MAYYTDLKSALSDPHQYGGYGSLRQYSYHGIDPTLGNTAGSMTPFPTGDRYDRTPIEEPEDDDEEIDDFVDMLATDKVYKKMGGTTYKNDFGAQASTDARTLTKNQATMEQMQWDTPARSGLSPFSRSTLYGKGNKGSGPSIGGDNLSTKWATDSAGAPMRQTGTLGWAHPTKSLSDLDDGPVIFNLEDFLNSPATDKAARSMFRHQYNVKKILSDLEKE